MPVMHLLSPTEGVDPAVLRDEPTFLRLSMHDSQNPRRFAEQVPPITKRGYKARLIVSLVLTRQLNITKKTNKSISLLGNLRLAEALGTAMPKNVPPGPAAGLEFRPPAPPLLPPPGSPDKRHKTQCALSVQSTNL